MAYEYSMNIHVLDQDDAPLRGATVTIDINDKPRVQGVTRGLANEPLKLRFNADADTVRMLVTYPDSKGADRHVSSLERDVTIKLPDVKAPETTLAKTWVMVVGAVFGGLTLLFLMGLVLLGISGREVPCNTTWLVNAILSFTAAFAAAFIGGNASARGALTLPLLRDNPIAVSAGGGIAVLIIMLILTTNLFGRTCGPTLSVSCPIGMQSRVVDELRFGFCYPREAWELDSGPIDVRAADIYLRRSGDRDTGVHFHVSLIPAAWAGKPLEYSAQVARTWSQLDANIRQSKTFIGGRDAYVFSLHVKDRLGRPRPTEITHIYLDSERLLEIIATWFTETPSQVTDQIQQVKSSLTFSRT